MKDAFSTKQRLVTTSHHDFAVTCFNPATAQHALLSAIPIAKESVVTPFAAGEIWPYATRHTIQTGDMAHISLQPHFLRYTNHSCNPNVFFDTASMELICLRNISPGEEITFFYPSSEWELREPFDCQCGNQCCTGTIKGAAYLPIAIIQNYRFTQYIQHKLCLTQLQQHS